MRVGAYVGVVVLRPPGGRAIGANAAHTPCSDLLSFCGGARRSSRPPRRELRPWGRPPLHTATLRCCRTCCGRVGCWRRVVLAGARSAPRRRRLVFPCVWFPFPVLRSAGGAPVVCVCMCRCCVLPHCMSVCVRVCFGAQSWLTQTTHQKLHTSHLFFSLVFSEWSQPTIARRCLCWCPARAGNPQRKTLVRSCFAAVELWASGCDAV